MRIVQPSLRSSVRKKEEKRGWRWKDGAIAMVWVWEGSGGVEAGVGLRLVDVTRRARTLDDKVTCSRPSTAKPATRAVRDSESTSFHFVSLLYIHRIRIPLLPRRRP